MAPKRAKSESEGEDELADGEPELPYIRGRLEPPEAGVISLKDLYTMIKTKLVDLEVEFQRDVVWPPNKQTGLILSIMQNYPIPQIYFSYRRNPDGSGYRATLDGKQRLTSVFRFFEGEIPYIPEGSKIKYFYKSGPAVKGKAKVMSDAEKEEIEQKTLTCVEYFHLTDIQERDMFQRVQMGMPLKEGEKLQSLAGPWAAWILSMVKRFVEPKGMLGDHLDWETARGSAFQSITCVVAMASNPSAAAHRSYSALHKFITTQTGDPNSTFAKSIEDTLEKLLKIAKAEELRKPFREGTPRVSPIEFQMTCMLIWMMRERPLNVISAEIENMRRDVRSKHVDIRSNSRVFDTMWTYCKKAAGKRGDYEFTGDAPVKKRKVR